LLKLSILDGHEKLQKDLVATLATLSALLVTLSTSGDFGRKWQANRLAASEMENLAYDLLPQGKPVNVADVIQKLQAINTARNLLVAGTDKSIVKPQATPPASGSDRAKPLPSPSPSPSK
jgi:hypothetical protein